MTRREMLKTVPEAPGRHVAYTPCLADAFTVDPRRWGRKDRFPFIHIRQYSHSIGAVPGNVAVACRAPVRLFGSNRDMRPVAEFLPPPHILCTGAPPPEAHYVHTQTICMAARTFDTGPVGPQALPTGAIYTPAAKFCENYQNASCGFVRFRIDHGHQRGGRLAQLVERLVYTEDVGSSSLSSPTIFPKRSGF